MKNSTDISGFQPRSIVPGAGGGHLATEGGATRPGDECLSAEGDGGGGAGGHLAEPFCGTGASLRRTAGETGDNGE